MTHTKLTLTDLEVESILSTLTEKQLDVLEIFYRLLPDVDFDNRVKSFTMLLRHCAQASDPEAFAVKHGGIKLLPYTLENVTRATRALSAFMFSPFHIECVEQGLFVEGLAAAYIIKKIKSNKYDK
jgi:hypothetical protein